ncbi:hypothetical protein Ade02nite_64620 [Paractinoplanes deccanensis]|uniref:Uncharacterized protein n=1 Tax=Paractinoplanes deccanensis TaxID=113561 RepID=A0ABQ3YCT8_9ACTN|nr:hypothetical protein [Actinoplanes deccanensis]GID77821.1 hypothetical protein Ade02nite_64620 [Actinoplanes deccanensis]
MTETSACELTRFLRATGPARVPTRMCCMAALLGRRDGAPVSGLCGTRPAGTDPLGAAAPTEPTEPRIPAAVP